METNYQHYQKEIIELLRNGEDIAKTQGHLHKCEVQCEHCDFNEPYSSKNCNEVLAEWLEQEYKPQEIDWTKVPKFTKVRVMNGRNLKPYYFLGVADDGNFMTTKCDEYTYSEGDYVRWKYCKLDESVDPAPYLKEAKD